MISETLLSHLNEHQMATLAWAAAFSDQQKARLGTPEIGSEVEKLSYLDAWRRQRRTTVLILKTIERFDSLGN